jgi:hypothetical protein
MFDGLLLYVSKLHVNLLIVFHCSKSLAKRLLQLFKSAIWMVLNVIFFPFRDIIPESKTKQGDDVKFYYFTINFNDLFEHFDVSIKISVFDIGWIL